MLNFLVQILYENVYQGLINCISHCTMYMYLCSTDQLSHDCPTDAPVAAGDKSEDEAEAQAEWNAAVTEAKKKTPSPFKQARGE